MTEQQIARYLQLASRKTFILLHSGTDWKPEYASELMAIDQELTELMKVKEQAHAQREQAAVESNKVPRMLTIREAAAETGLSYDYLRKLCIQGRVVYIRAGAKRLINFDKLLEFLNRGESAGESQQKTLV